MHLCTNERVSVFSCEESSTVLQGRRALLDCTCKKSYRLLFTHFGISVRFTTLAVTESLALWRAPRSPSHSLAKCQTRDSFNLARRKGRREAGRGIQFGGRDETALQFGP